MKRRDKANYYLDVAETILNRSTCIRRNFGAVIVKNDELISTGYNGAPWGRKNCLDLDFCMREKLEIPRGERYELCRSVHAEQNAIISASRKDLIGASLYLVGKEYETGEYIKNPAPCMFCKRFIINAGIKEIILRNDKDNYQIVDVNEYIENDDSLEGKFGY